MREIRFRAWDDVLLKMLPSISLEQIATFDFSNTNFIQLEIMQYTGFKDKNIIDIYEGDILKGKYWDDYSKTYKRIIGFVNYSNCSFKLEGVKQYNLTKVDFDSSFEIIGNIYENPELLKEEQYE